MGHHHHGVVPPGKTGPTSPAAALVSFQGQPVIKEIREVRGGSATHPDPHGKWLPNDTGTKFFFT